MWTSCNSSALRRHVQHSSELQQEAIQMSLVSTTHVQKGVILHNMEWRDNVPGTSQCHVLKNLIKACNRTIYECICNKTCKLFDARMQHDSMFDSDNIAQIANSMDLRCIRTSMSRQRSAYVQKQLSCNSRCCSAGTFTKPSNFVSWLDVSTSLCKFGRLAIPAVLHASHRWCQSL